MRSYTSSSAVQGEFAYGYSHSIHALVAKSKNAPAVRDDSHMNGLAGPVVYHTRHVAAIFGRKVHSPRTSKVMPKLQTQVTHGGRVDDGRELFQVVDKNAVEESLVAIVELSKVEPFGQATLLDLADV